jgi:hypothetical protein
MGLYGFQWQFCEYLEDQRLFTSLNSFTTYFVTSFWSLNLNWEISIQDSGAAGYVYQRFIFQFFWKIMKEKDWSDPQPDSAIQPKARGLLHMEREYFAHHVWSRFRGMSTSQPRSNWKYLEDYLTYLKEGPEATRRMFWLLEVLEGCSDYLKYRKYLEDSATKSSGACQIRGSGTAYMHRIF